MALVFPVYVLAFFLGMWIVKWYAFRGKAGLAFLRSQGLSTH